MKYYKDNDRPIQPHDIYPIYMGLIPSSIDSGYFMIQFPYKELLLPSILPVVTCSYSHAPVDVEEIKKRAFLIGRNFLVINQNGHRLIRIKWTHHEKDIGL